jgi:hypothetical protein
MRLSTDDQYCLKSDSLKYFHPDMVLEDIYATREHVGI